MSQSTRKIGGFTQGNIGFQALCLRKYMSGSVLCVKIACT